MPETPAEMLARVRTQVPEQPTPGAGSPSLVSLLQERISALEESVRNLGQQDALAALDGAGRRRDIEALRRDLSNAVWQKGEKGDKGDSIKGDPGPSVQGKKGEQGEQGLAGVGIRGEQGDRGASAFEVAVMEGYRGTAQEWLRTLRGKDGADGKDGKDGLAGGAGVQGPAGREGPRGLASVVQPKSGRATPVSAPPGSLPKQVACPACGEVQDLKAQMGVSFGISSQVKTGCLACHRIFRVTADGVALLCEKCGYPDVPEHICRVQVDS